MISLRVDIFYVTNDWENLDKLKSHKSYEKSSLLLRKLKVRNMVVDVDYVNCFPLSMIISGKAAVLDLETKSYCKESGELLCMNK